MLARTVTDSIVPTASVAESKLLAPSVVVTFIFQISAEPGVWLLFVGLINVGTWVEQLAPDAEEQPISIVTVVPAFIAPVPTVHVMSGALTVNVQAAVPAEKFAFILLADKLLKANVVADGDAELFPEPGNPITIVPPIGIAVVTVKATVCIAVIGTISTSEPAPAFTPTVPLRYTDVKGDDWEAIGIFVPKMLAVPCRIRIPESDAKYLEPLLKTESAPSEEDAFALRGLDGEGREVDKVSLADESDAASTFPENRKKTAKTTTKIAFFKNFMHLLFNGKKRADVK